MQICFPARVTKVNLEELTVDVKLVSNRVQKTQEDGLVKLPNDEYEGVPIVFQNAGGYIITLPVKVGDDCMLVFADSNFSDWFLNDTEELDFDGNLDFSLSMSGKLFLPMAVFGLSNLKRVESIEKSLSLLKD